MRNYELLEEAYRTLIVIQQLTKGQMFTDQLARETITLMEKERPSLRETKPCAPLSWPSEQPKKKTNNV